LTAARRLGSRRSSSDSRATAIRCSTTSRWPGRSTTRGCRPFRLRIGL